jgi:hypothetical protein
MNYLLLFFGIGLVIFALGLFILDRKKTNSEIRDLERANAQTEYLIEELNELSSIIMDEMEKKYNKMLDTYQELLSVSATEQQEQEESGQDKVFNDQTGMKNKRKSIVELHKSGISPSEIASRIGIGTGEVELVLRFAGQEVGNNTFAK